MTNYRLSNKEVILLLKEMLAVMDVKNYNVFRVRAYQNAISILDNLTVSIYDMWENKKLGDIPGVGPALQGHLNELFTTGKVVEFEEAQKDLPQGMFSLIGIRGIGARKAFKLAMAFKLNSRETAIEKLKEHALKGEVQKIEGFGEKSEKDILESVDQLKMTKNEKERTLLVRAEEIVFRVYEYMKELDCVLQIESTGSFRRRSPTVGDLDFIISTREPAKIFEHFAKFPEIAETLVVGDKKTSVVLTNGMQVDVRVTEPEAYGAMLQYSTGSKQHNILLRSYSLEKKMSLSEYGIKQNDELLQFDTEEKFYNHLGLPLIPPELRSGHGEIEAAKVNKLPKLIELKDIRGDVHTHTTDSDGLATLEEMVEAAIHMGYEYIGISDHAPSVMSRGFDEVAAVVHKKRQMIDAINKKQNKIKVLFGYEVNILADATLGLPDELLKLLDYAIAGIHTSFDQDRDTVTKRLICALENPYINILAHPSGRLINKRDPVDPNWNKIFEAARDNGKILEIDSQPDRLDLTDDLIKEAISWDVKMILSSDAHAIDQLYFTKCGIDDARRGWAEKQNVINTLHFEDFVKALNVRNL